MINIFTATDYGNHVIDVIQGKSEPTTTPENGVHQSELMDAIYESAKLGRTVSLSELTG